MGFEFFYTFKMDAKRDLDSIAKILHCASQCGYSFYTPFNIRDDQEKPFHLDIESAAKFLLKQHPLSQEYSGIDFVRNDNSGFHLKVEDDEKKLSLSWFIYARDYEEIIALIPSIIEVLRPFKISHFDMREDYFLGWPMLPTPEHNGPIIWGNLKSEWPVLYKNIISSGFKVFYALNGTEIITVKTGVHDRDYEFPAFLIKPGITIKVLLSGYQICLMPEKPYVMYNYETGEDIDTAYYLDLYFKLAKDARVLDMVEAKNF